MFGKGTRKSCPRLTSSWIDLTGADKVAPVKQGNPIESLSRS